MVSMDAGGGTVVGGGGAAEDAGAGAAGGGAAVSGREGAVAREVTVKSERKAGDKWRCLIQVGKKAPGGGPCSGSVPGWADEADSFWDEYGEPPDRETHIVMGLYLRVHPDKGDGKDGYADLELRFREKPGFWATKEEQRACRRRKMVVGLSLSDHGLRNLAKALLQAEDRVKPRWKR
jgi:hypothetical protein